MKLVDPRWEQVSIVAVQHLLESTGSLLKVLIELGVQPNRIHILGKHYSSNQEVAETIRAEGINVYRSTDFHPPGEFARTFRADVSDMWTKVQEAFASEMPALVIVLDDGGRCIEAIPDELIRACRVIGIEQTTSGIRTTSDSVDVIQVATSAAKKLLEPSLIADAVFDKVRTYLPRTKRVARCGVIGLGSIGKAIASGLINMGHDVYATDKDVTLSENLINITWCNDSVTVLNNADYILGCTGEDVFLGANGIEDVRGMKILLSVSSEDVEFNSLLKIGRHENYVSSLHDINLTFPTALFKIVKGGFPVNFDGTRASVPSEAIQLTRGLLLGGIVQAALLHKSHKHLSSASNYMLDPSLQQFVVREWCSTYSQSSSIPLSLIDSFQNADWIASNSKGFRLQIEPLRDALA